MDLGIIRFLGGEFETQAPVVWDLVCGSYAHEQRGMQAENDGGGNHRRMLKLTARFPSPIMLLGEVDGFQFEPDARALRPHEHQPRPAGSSSEPCVGPQRGDALREHRREKS